MEVSTLFIGIDVSKSSLAIGYRLATKTPYITTKIQNTEEALSVFFKDLASQGHSSEQVHVVFEFTGTYSSTLVYFLDEQGIKMSALTPDQSAAYARTCKDISKTDNRDACRLAHYGSCQDPKLFVAPTPEQVHLKQLTILLGQYRKQIRAKNNQIHALVQHPHTSREVLLSLEADVEHLERQMQKCEQTLAGHFLPPAPTADNPKPVLTAEQVEFKKNIKLAKSVSGVGPAIATDLMIGTNNFKAFNDVKQLAKYIGIAPGCAQSGTSLKGKGRIVGGVKSLRNLLYMGSWSAIRYNPACKALYERLRAKGKPRNLALIAVAYKLLRTIWGVIKSGVPFDRDFGSPQAV